MADENFRMDSDDNKEVVDTKLSYVCSRLVSFAAAGAGLTQCSPSQALRDSRPSG